MDTRDGDVRSVRSAVHSGRRAARGFGVAGDLAPAIVGELAPAAERAGYRTFWVNDTPRGDGLAALEAAAHRTTSIQLGVGLLPLDRWTPPRIVQRATELALPVERLTIAVGSGRGTRGLARVRGAVVHLRRSLDVRISVGALGPKMRRLAGEVADGLLLDWVTPPFAGRCVAEAEWAAAAVARPRPAVDAYVFTALGEGASRRLRAQIGHYSSVRAYASHFARMDARPGDAAVAAATPEGLRGALRPFDDVLDETIVRAVVGGEDVASYLELLTAAAPK